MNHYNFESKSAQEILKWSISEFGPKAGLASSFGMEDMVIIDVLSQLKGDITIFTLDTGRLHEETYEVMERARSKYGVTIKVYFPNKEDVENLQRNKGFFSFRESMENRKECCSIRKIEPLNRALSNLDAWITGLRRDQGLTRVDVEKVAIDDNHNSILKINPLADWSLKMIEEYIKINDVPINALHKKNYPSIGCAPCTRSIEKGEDIRSGRWWWENPEHKECGLHPRS
ncbi:MAG: phosphoadenylyl-sulfate reductase [Nitrospina sp.]|nr:phosphoadenylyl-sulfate reductase [Nitrospina sp.]MBT6602233.1 phosphoadenylyl-sulfate reductase [Nitrospina sp.]